MKKLPLTSLVAVALLLGGCAAQNAPPTSESIGELSPIPAQALSTCAEVSEGTDPALEKYIDVLEGIYYDHVLPDGQRLEPFEDSAEEYPNEFAIFDVDSDGEDELIILYSNTYTAGMFGAVYGYDRAEGALTTQIVEFPALSFYPNGSVQVGWSHNQGLAGRFWPFTLYQYDAVLDSYLPVACVDAWDGAYFETDFDGNPFPAEVDTDGTNIVYYIYPYDNGTYHYVSETLPTPICHTDFYTWYNRQISLNSDHSDPMEHALDVPFQPITQETILAIT